jgi:hypothetical protein
VEVAGEQDLSSLEEFGTCFEAAAVVLLQLKKSAISIAIASQRRVGLNLLRAARSAATFGSAIAKKN